MPAEWINQFPALADLDADSARALTQSAQPVAMPAGTVVFQPGAACGAYLLLVGGTVRVQMVAENGREIVLYRVSGGETCVLTTACLMAHQAYGAEAVAETDIAAISVPEGVFRKLLASSDVFREFVFSAYGARLTDLMVLVEEVAFRRLDLRLAEFLSERGEDGGVIAMTHQALAVELGSVREVVSRVLKEFEHRGWLRLARGRIEISDAPGMRRYIVSLSE